VTLTGSDITIGDLREFIADLDGQPDNLAISYRYYSGNQMDRTTLTLTALLPHRRPSQSGPDYPPGARSAL